MHRKQMNNGGGMVKPWCSSGLGLRGAHLSHIYACFAKFPRFQLARSFFPYGVDLSEACQLSRELTALIGLKKIPNWFLGLVNPDSEPYMYQKKKKGES